MKQWLMTLSLALMVQVSWALSLGDVWQDIRKETHVTVLDGVQAGHFLDISNGQSKALAMNSVLAYRFIRADVGWTNDLGGRRVGDAVGGGSVRVDELIDFVFPNIKPLIRHLTPLSAHKFLDMTFVGYAGGWNFDRGAPVHGLTSGIELKWK